VLIALEHEGDHISWRRHGLDRRQDRLRRQDASAPADEGGVGQWRFGSAPENVITQLTAREG